MRLVIQRVSEAKVTVEDKVVGTIGKGLLVLLGVHVQDTEAEVHYCVEKLIHLRIFSDQQGKMNLSLKEVSGDLLLVSQFTLYGNCKDGRRPSFIEAARPEKAELLYEVFIKELKKNDMRVETGIFGAHMQVSLVNDGPVTLILESREIQREKIS